jgi:predicted O-methyltransferase YrrM
MTARTFFKYTALGRWLLVPYRLFGIAAPHGLRQFASIFRWAFQSKEYYNYTYDLTPLNREYLASFVAVVAGATLSMVRQFVQELDNDEPLRSALRNTTLRSPDRHNADLEPRYGRRLGWYALVRATKPRVVLETGIDRGLGTVVLAAAMHRNAQEGSPGLVYATDIVPDCGYLIVEPYKQYVRILLGDSVESLRKFQEPVDIFLHDSDHRAEYEWAEFMAIQPKLHARSLVLSDNSNQTSKLLEFAGRLGKSFLYFQDQPQDHWWPGDGVGAAFVPGVKTFFPDRKT